MIEFFFQGGNDGVVKKMHNMQFLSGGWLELQGTKQWGLIWRQTKVNPTFNSDLKCTAVKIKTTTGQKLDVWKCK